MTTEQRDRALAACDLLADTITVLMARVPLCGALAGTLNAALDSIREALAESGPGE